MKQIFYVFDEHTDIVKECQKNSLVPCGNDSFEHVSGESKYVLLSLHQCYSGWPVTLMALPCLDYEGLIGVLETSKIYDEIVGCIGILLRNHKESFIDYLARGQTQRTQKVKKIILKDIVDNSSYVAKMKQLIKICQE